MLVVLFASGVTRSIGFTAYNTIVFSDVPEAQMRDANVLFSTVQTMAIGLGVAVGALAVRPEARSIVCSAARGPGSLRTHSRSCSSGSYRSSRSPSRSGYRGTREPLWRCDAEPTERGPAPMACARGFYAGSDPEPVFPPPPPPPPPPLGPGTPGSPGRLGARSHSMIWPFWIRNLVRAV